MLTCRERKKKKESDMSNGKQSTMKGILMSKHERESLIM